MASHLVAECDSYTNGPAYVCKGDSLCFHAFENTLMTRVAEKNDVSVELKQACRRDMMILFFYMVGVVTASDMMDTVSPTTVAVGDKRHRTSYLDPPWEQWNEDQLADKLADEPCLKKRRKHRRREILKRERYECIECCESFSDHRRLRAHYQREHKTHGEPFHRSRFCYEGLRGNSNAFTFVCKLCFETTKCYDPRCCSREARKRLLAGETVNLDQYSNPDVVPFGEVQSKYGTVCWHGCEVWGYHAPGKTKCKRAMRPNVHMFENIAHLKSHVMNKNNHHLNQPFDPCLHQLTQPDLFSYFVGNYGVTRHLHNIETRLARFGIQKDSKIWNDMMFPNTHARRPQWTKILKHPELTPTCPIHIFQNTFGIHNYLPFKTFKQTHKC
jgi:hypothetical protein